MTVFLIIPYLCRPVGECIYLLIKKYCQENYKYSWYHPISKSESESIKVQDIQGFRKKNFMCILLGTTFDIPPGFLSFQTK